MTILVLRHKLLYLVVSFKYERIVKSLHLIIYPVKFKIFVHIA